LTHNTCDYCGCDFKSVDTAKKDSNGKFYSANGEYYLPFTCPRCGGKFCDKHRLPENHSCTGEPPTPHSKRLETPSVNRFKQEDYDNTPGIIPSSNSEEPMKDTSSERYYPKPRRFTINNPFKRFRGYDFYQTRRRIIDALSWVFVISFIIFFGLPVGLAYLISNQKLDYFTRIIMSSIINTIYATAAIYIVCAFYLVYCKYSRKNMLAPYAIVAIFSVGSVWYVLDKAKYLLVLSALFNPQLHFMPDIFNVYQIWCYVLLDGMLSLLSSAISFAPSISSAINNVRNSLAINFQRFLSGS
jgi:hypothetical protein